MIENFSTTLMNNYNNIIYVNLTFLGTVLAIFFTLVTLPLQNILGKYSQDLVKHVNEDKVFKYSLFIFFIVFAYNLSLFAFTKVPLRIGISLSLGFLSLLTLRILIGRTSYLLDFRNQLKCIAEKIKSEMSSRIKKEEGERNIYGSTPKFDIPIPFSDWLKDETELIIDVSQKAIEEDRFEIVESGFENISSIVQEYINIREDYQTDQDPFLTYYLLYKLRDSKELISLKSHPKILESIVEVASKVAHETLRLKTFRAKFGENVVTDGFVHFLEEIIASDKIYYNTTSYAINNACNQLISITEKAIDAGYPATASLYIEELGKLGRIITNMKDSYASFISRKINKGIISLFDYVLSNYERACIENNRFIRRTILEKCITEINNNIKEFLKTGYKHNFVSDIQFLTGIVPELTVSRVFGKALLRVKKNVDYGMEILDLLEKFLSEFNHNIKIALKERRSSEIRNFLFHICALGIYLVVFTKNFKNRQLKGKTAFIIKNEMFNILYSPILELAKNKEFGSYPIGQFLNIFTLILGMMIVENKEGLFTEIINKWIKKNLKLIESNEEIIYKYLKLIGSWLFKFKRKSHFLKTIKNNLRNQSKKAIEFPPLYDRTLSLYIPLRALDVDARYFMKIETELFDVDNQRKFEDFLKSEGFESHD